MVKKTINIDGENKEVILFYKEGEEHGFLSNFHPSSITTEVFSELDAEGNPAEDSRSLGNYTFPTAEHLFQALKLSHILNARPRIEMILKDPTPLSAKKTAET